VYGEEVSRSALLALATTLAVAASAAAAATSGGSTGVSLTVPSSQRDGVPFGTVVLLRGSVVTAGRADSGAAVQLQQARYPRLNRFTAVQTTTTNPDGSFSFAVRPTINTAYRAAAVVRSTQKVSPARVVYAFARPGTLTFTSSGLHLRARIGARAPSARMLQGTAVSFYYREQGDARFTLAGDSVLQSVGGQLASAVLGFNVPHATPKIRVGACLHTIPGLGRPQPACGRSSLPPSAFP
jgi:hypothetical protein